MTQPSPEDPTVRPFRIDVPQADLDDLHARLARTRWPDDPDDGAWDRGVPRAYLRELAAYWHATYDWRAQEARLNALPQVATTVDGQRLHCFHVRSPAPDARPLLLLHGWPSSPVEFLRVVAPLTEPDPAGGAAYHLVIPSLPGYAFSTPLSRPGWGNLFVVAQACAELMRRLGYARYGVHGGDVGAGVAALLGAVDAGRVVGVHQTGPAPAMPLGPALDPAPFAGADRARAERFAAFQRDGTGYLHLQSTRPRTVGYALHDSPVGQLAWMVEKYREWTDPGRPTLDDAVDRDQLLTNVSVTWFTGTGASSAHTMYDGMQAWKAMAAAAAGGADGGGGGWAAPDAPPPPPVGVSVFAADASIRRLVDPAGTVRHWSEFDRGGHFPAMEAPNLLAADLRAFFDPLA